tara:strand:- start:378 stop:518 length:141 start_codon:yes stop_codon:yes gene_type:complete
MSEERPFLQLPLPSPEEEQRMHEEWLKRNELNEDDSEEERVVVIEL